MIALPEKSIHLIACSAKKAKTRRIAVYLYQGDLFRKALKIAEACKRRNGDSFFILSAKHGLLDPYSALEPYEKRMPTSKAERELWADLTFTALRQLRCYREASSVIFWTGQDYWEGLASRIRSDGFRSKTVLTPLSSQGIGKQKQLLNKYLEVVS
ncbi:MAG TPA: hypothetical protein EYO33_21020 [Phycisphaerales bacterium]|nr:hypothetical protein [Phycisphaerales bacterium]